MSKNLPVNRFAPAIALLATMLVWALEVHRTQIHPDGNGLGGGEALLLWAVVTVGMHVSAYIFLVVIRWIFVPQSDVTEAHPLHPHPVPIVIIQNVVEAPARYSNFWDEVEANK